MLPWLDIALRVAILFGLIASWIATVIPIFPAPTLMWALTLIYGIVAGFEVRGAILFGIISLLTVISWLADNFFGIVGARKGGARCTSVAVAWAVGLVTSILFTPIIGIVLTVGALFAVESYYKETKEEAWQATKSMLLGWGWATVVRMGIGLIQIILWVIWAWF